VDLLPRSNHTIIRTERAPKTKIEWAPTIIGNDPASFFDEERSGGVVLQKTHKHTHVKIEFVFLQNENIRQRTQIFSWYPPASPPRPPPATGKRK
jgi:hypothetical protein